MFHFDKKPTPFYNWIVGIRRRIIFPKLCHGLFKIIAERIHIFQVVQCTGFDILKRGGSQNLERPNIERPVFRKFETSNIEITKVELFDFLYFFKLQDFEKLLLFEIEQFQKFDVFWN